MKSSASENTVLNASLQLLELRAVYAWRNNNVAVYDRTIGRYRKHVGLPGVADILGILPSGRFLAVETKAPGCPAFGKRPGTLSGDQRAFLESIKAMNGVGVVAWDVGRLAAVLDALAIDPWRRFTIEGYPE